MIAMFRPFGVCLALGLVAATARANEAQVVFHCESVRLYPANLTHEEVAYRLEATTTADITLNDEIGVSDEGTYLHGSTLVLTDVAFSTSLWFDCSIEVPDPADSNWNGISDFFEVDRSVTDLPSVGEFEYDDGWEVYAGWLELTWNRAAGQTTGTCQLRLLVEDYYDVGDDLDLTFEHTFEIYDYRGAFTYTVEGNNVLGSLTLTRSGAGGQLVGPMPLERIDYSELAFPAFALTNELNQAIQFYSSADLEITLLRGGLRTNYFTVLYTEDGWPATDTIEEYEIWVFHVFDANDSDQDGIPDLSDDPAPPKPPGLAIRSGADTVELDVLAQTGQQATLEQTPQLAPPNWAIVQTVTLTNTTHTVELPAPTAPTFWRVRVE